MIPRAEQLAAAVAAYRCLSDVRFENGTVSGVMLSDADGQRVVSELDRVEILVHKGDFSGARAPSLQAVEFLVPRHEEAFFASNLDDLLTYSFATRRAPENLYLAAGDELVSAQSPATDQRTLAYLAVLKLVALVQAAADHHYDDFGVLKLVFLQKEKLEVAIKFSADDLDGVKPVVVDELERDITQPIHQDARRTILRSVLTEELRSVVAADRFAELVRRLSDFHRRFQENYEIYVAEFSFEKILADVQKNKLEYTAKLNKNFSDIQNQLLAIPVAVVLVGGQMKAEQGLSITNAVILAGAFIFAILMDFLIRNQRHTLAAIEEEVEALRREVEAKQATLYERVKGHYAALQRRGRTQRVLLRTIDAMVALSLGGTCLLFAWYAGWLQHYF